jgi:hypothetical protein
VPTLSMHTVADQLAPVEFEHEYARRVSAAGRGGLLRQAFVQAVGHCNFTTAEYVTAVRAVRQRLHRSGWGAIADPERLQADAQSLGLDGRLHPLQARTARQPPQARCGPARGLAVGGAGGRSGAVIAGQAPDRRSHNGVPEAGLEPATFGL